MRKFAILAVILATISISSRDAQAEGRYWPWCAHYDDYSYNCGFATFQQCLATISGAGGICQANPYPPPAAEGQSRGRRARSR